MRNNNISKKLIIVENIKKNKKNCIKIIKIISKYLFEFYSFEPKFYKLYILLPCGHSFHRICLEIWFKDKNICPICRQPITLFNQPQRT